MPIRIKEDGSEVLEAPYTIGELLDFLRKHNHNQAKWDVVRNCLDILRSSYEKNEMQRPDQVQNYVDRVVNYKDIM